MAPVKAPFSWPKSSDSTIVSGRAERLTPTNLASAAPLVNEARDQLLAGATLSENEHVGGRGSSLCRDLEGAPQRRGGADDAPVAELRELLPEALVLDDELVAFSRLADGLDHLHPLERLLDEVVRPGSHGLDGFLDGAEGGHQHDLGVRDDGLRAP